MPNRLAYNRDPLRSQGFRTQRAELPEDLWQPLYDRERYPTAGTAGSISFFKIAKGGTATLNRGGTVAAISKTWRDTNMETSGVMPAKMFVIHGISVGYAVETIGHVNVADDREMIRDNCYIEWKIVDKDILHIPLMCIPDLNPIVFASSTVNNDTVIGCAGGGGPGVPMFRLPIPITLNPYENFNFDIKWDGTCATPSTNDVDIIVILWSFMRRPT